MYRHILHILALLFIPLACFAQNSLWNKADSVLIKFAQSNNCDTLYLSRPKSRWTLQLRTNVSNTSFHTQSFFHDAEQQVEMMARPRLTLGVSASYRGLSGSLSLNPVKISGAETDVEYNFRAYGNKFGGELIGVSTRTLKGSITQSNTTTTIDAGSIKQDAIYLNGYYAFNNRRFSYPAAFTMSYIQKKSAGSWLLGASFYAYEMNADDKKSDQIINSSLSGMNVGIGGGYGYNWVPHKDWLVHISALPTFIVYERGKLDLGFEEKHLLYRFPEVIIVGRGAITYSHKNFIYGANMVYNYSSNGNQNDFNIQNQRFRLRLFIGYRIH